MSSLLIKNARYLGDSVDLLVVDVFSCLLSKI